MVAFLNIDSQFVQHVAGNILSSLSCFLSKYGKKWVEFVHMLKISLEASISSICSSTSLSAATKGLDESWVHGYPLIFDESFHIETPYFDFTRYVVLLKSRLQKVNWFVVAALLRILRSILKSLKHEVSDLEGVFVNLVISSLMKLPWDLFSGIYVNQSYDVQLNSVQVDSSDRKKYLNEIIGVLLGTVAQLFCSLFEQNDAEDEEDNPLDELVVKLKSSNLVPQLLSCCFSKCLGHQGRSISLYLRHKSLILMNRLSFDNQWQSSHPAIWLKLIKLYFKDLIFHTFSKCNVGFENCVEGSPFSSSINDADICPRHLQRLAIFFYFKCCFRLVSWKESGQGCTCTAEARSVTSGLQFYCEKCCYIGSLELSQWLEWFGFLQKSMDSGDYSKSCSSFALSFLQLYLEEDDLFFRMLLLLLDAPFSLHKLDNANGKSPRKVEIEVLQYMKSIFDPVRLFHLFLSLLHYDHSVLIDYLISKDTGVQCVQYLLRCLRIVCKSWYVFVEFLACGSETSQRSLKRKKISMASNRKLGSSSSSEVKKLGSSSSSEVKKLGSSSFSEVRGNLLRRETSGRTYRGISMQSFENAKECLLALKRSVANLHQKSLFPYNPRPLLKSLSRFEDLCSQ